MSPPEDSVLIHPSGPNEGDRVRITRGDYSGYCGTYEGHREDAFGEWHLVHLDGDHRNDPPVRCDRVEPING